MPSFPWRPTFFGTPATEDRPFHAMIEYHRCPPNASIISCFDKKSIEIGSNKPISPCSSMYASMIRLKITRPPAKGPAAHTAAAGRMRLWGLGPEAPSRRCAPADGPWLPPGGAAAARKWRCIRHAPLLRQKGAGLPEGVEGRHAAPIITVVSVGLIVRKAGTGLRRSGAGQRHKV